MKKISRKPSRKAESDRPKTITVNRAQRGTSRGSERVSEYRGRTRYDQAYDRDYDVYDRDLSRNNEERSEYERRNGNNWRHDYRFEDEYPGNQYTGRHRKHEWDEGFGDYDDYNEYEDTYEDRDKEYGMSDEMEDRGYAELYRGRRKRRNTPEGYSEIFREGSWERGRNSAVRGDNSISSRGLRRGKYREEIFGESSRGDRRGGTAGRSSNRSGGAYHTWDEPGIRERSKKIPRRAYDHIDDEPRVASRYGSSPRGNNNSERSSTREKRSKLGNSAPGSRLTNRTPKTRKKGAKYVSVVVDKPVVTRSKSKGIAGGKRQKKSKAVRNY